MSLFKGERLVNALLSGNSSVAGYPLLTAMGLPATTGYLYVVGNPADTNISTFATKFGQVTYPDGTSMYQTDLQSAINATADWRGDIILVGPRTWTITTPILFNKKGITVMASFNISGQDNGERFQLNADATANIPCAKISEPCTLIGLGFDSANTTAASDAGSYGTVFLGTGSGFDGGNYSTLYRCRFDNWGHANYAIGSNYNDYLKIIECDFDGTINGAGNSANAFTAGIHITQGHYTTIENNTFRGCAYAIQHGTPNPADADHSNQNFVYKGNRVIVAGGTEKFIDFNTLATYSKSYGLVADNYLGTATDTASYNDTVANAKTGKVTFSGNHYAE